ncbi:tubulin-specific chaperone a [Anaeramoeba flamelloides]|uniref:Tubulin-specific chaperone A n=2 Tax=Anaeramoeba flamelloides TaxID=1746091 RepID=A0AAV7YSH3_9EUKA|nr:tubulin-specific chaperone a [Anaeramoeba flamelloides]
MLTFKKWYLNRKKIIFQTSPTIFNKTNNLTIEIMSNSVKQIKIKTGACKRLYKEKNYYEMEATKQENKIKELRNKNTDQYTINKQEEILQETRSMIPDCTNRLQNYYEGLVELVENERDNEVVNQTTQYKDALEIIEEVKHLFD